MPHHTTDVLIVGSGPVGLFAIFECGMLKLQCHVVDTLDVIGGQCRTLYPEKPIYDIPAHPVILAQDLITNLEQQAAPFKPMFHLSQQVVSIERTAEQKFLITTSKDVTIEASAIIIAAGVGAFGPHKPPLENITQYEGKSVFYYVAKKEDFRDKKIIIAGGGDSAIDWAVALSEISHVTLVHRRSKFRAAPEMVAKMHALEEQGKLSLLTPYQLHGLNGENDSLTSVTIADMDGHVQTIAADILLPFYGLSMQLGPIVNWGLNMDHKHITTHPTTATTNVPGIFAIGDVATYEGKLKLILTGFSEAANAAHSARAYLRPNEVFHFEYSTTQGVSDIKN